MKLSVVKLGLIEYQSALSLQWKLLTLRQSGAIEDILLLLEHTAVITIGMSGKESNILKSEEYLNSRGISVYHANRGGDVTYHGPGQIVGYPIIDLHSRRKDVKGYVRQLEETFIRILGSEYHLSAERKPRYTGVWVGNEKITAIGCAVKRWVTMHGFAFNVNTELDNFTLINPCGINDKGVTSLEKLLEEPQDMIKAEERVFRYFSEVFGFEPQIVDKTDFIKGITELSNG